MNGINHKPQPCPKCGCTQDLREFTTLVANMKTEEEMEGGMVSEDAICTLNELIATARCIAGIDPQYPKVFEVEP